MREIDIQKRVLLALSGAGLLIWDHPTGMAVSKDILHRKITTILAEWEAKGCDPKATLGDILKVGRDFRFLSFGLVGSSDLVAVTPNGGKFVGIEMKKPGEKQESAQIAFEGAVKAHNGIYIVATSVDEALSKLRAAGAL